MATIPQQLRNEISKNPAEQYSVIITLKEEMIPAALQDKGKFIMGNKLLSAKISGEEIQNLLKQSEIEAIEPDVEMGIM